MNRNILQQESEINILDNNMEQTNIETIFKGFDTIVGSKTYRNINVLIDEKGQYGDKGKKYATLNLNKIDPKSKLPYCCERNNWTLESIKDETNPSNKHHWLYKASLKGN